MPAFKMERGYRFELNKFRRAGLTPVPSELVSAPRAAECPIALECTVQTMIDDPDRLPVTELDVLVVHAHPEVLVHGHPDRIDPDRWRPLIMSFQQFYGLTDGRLRPSTLAGPSTRICTAIKATTPRVTGKGRGVAE